MAWIQKITIAELDPFLDRLLEGQNFLDHLINFIHDLKIKVDLPGIDVQELDISLSGNILKISRKKNGEITTENKERDFIVAESAKMKVALGIADSMAKTNDAVMIFGASGTGKDLFARTIHRQSLRCGDPFIWLHCGTINDRRAEQQLQDYLLETKSGTLYIDEIEDLDMETQRLLLNLLEKPVTRQEMRLITATSADLESLVREGLFLNELLVLLQGCYIGLPPLRERKEDINPLAHYHIEQLCRNRGLITKILSPEYLQILGIYSWPGNVRELVNTLDQSLISSGDKKTLFAKNLPAHIRIQTISSSARQKQGL